MAYDIQNGPVPSGVQRPETRGRKSPFPIQNMQIGEWFIVPSGMEWKLGRAARYAKRKHGIQLQIMLDEARANWIAVRVK